MSTVTIFCRAGACNVENHTRDNCYNRYAATRTQTWKLTRRDWEVAKAHLVTDLAAVVVWVEQ